MYKKSGFGFQLLIVLLIYGFPASAQYFGQNKVRYKKLIFKVYKTPHFEIYYYLKNDSMIKRFAQESELWYTIHQQVFRDTFTKPNPIILYANHPDFQQTTAIDGEIDIGTGGITESLKSRVVMPVMESNQVTRHVIGHELVHAFQYHLLLAKDSTVYEKANDLPLWMIEGMAEYLSIGKTDSYTAMWMRDAYLNHDIPTLKALSESDKYFPYRYGQAFWAFVGSSYGDTTIVPLFKNSAKFGLEKGIRQTLGLNESTLSDLWKSTIESTYKPYLVDTVQLPIGRKIVDEKNGGKLNLAPSISPDGKYLAFLSEKDLLSVDLYLADANTGAVIKKLSNKVSNSHIDEFNFIESSGAWSPDSKRFAFSVFSKGRNRMVIIDIAGNRVSADISMGKAEQFSNLSWSPDGKKIVFQGLANGQSDLYLYDFDIKGVRQLTNDKYSDCQPSFSTDGKKVIFTSDRNSYDLTTRQDLTFDIEEMDLQTGLIQDINVFKGANNFNPLYSSDGSQIYFLSNKDGFRNLYRFTIASCKVEKMTNFFTGISGITENSPALSLSRNNDIIYSYYRKQRYTLYNAKANQFKAVEISDHTDSITASILPPQQSDCVDLINSNLRNFLLYPKYPADSIKEIPYRSKFKLDYLANNGVGTSVSQFGTGLSTGLQGVFSDILGRDRIYAGFAINGELYDLGGQFSYIHQKGRWNFGFSVSHVPFQTANYTVINSINQESSGSNVLSTTERLDIIRIFQDQVTLFTSYPFSKRTRLEFGTAFSKYYYRVDRYSASYDSLGNSLSNVHTHIAIKDYNMDPANNGISLNPFTIANVSTALVGDNSLFGVASPLKGYRYRIQGEYDFGTYNFFSPTIDLREYINVRPVTLAVRLYGVGRFGNTGNLYQLFVGYPFLIRGYEAQTFVNANDKKATNGFSISQLSGNRIAVANFEIRLPFTGPEKLSVIRSRFFFSELNFFLDAGLAWNQGDQIKFQKGPDLIGYQPQLDQNGSPVLDKNNKPVLAAVYNNLQRVPAISTGISLRINIFGYFVLEPYLALPFNRSDINKPVFGLGFTPGW